MESRLAMGQASFSGLLSLGCFRTDLDRFLRPMGQDRASTLKLLAWPIPSLFDSLLHYILMIINYKIKSIFNGKVVDMMTTTIVMKSYLISYDHPQINYEILLVFIIKPLLIYNYYRPIDTLVWKIPEVWKLISICIEIPPHFYLNLFICVCSSRKDNNMQFQNCIWNQTFR